MNVVDQTVGFFDVQVRREIRLRQTKTISWIECVKGHENPWLTG